MTAWGIILAAGKGERFGSSTPKAFGALAGKTLLERATEAFQDCDAVEGLVIVVPESLDRSAWSALRAAKVKIITSGGQSRTASVRAGIAAQLPATVDVVVVHDAARALVTPELIERALSGLEHADGAVCAIPVADTLKRADGEFVSETVARDGLWRAQTPQAFRLGVLRDAHARAEQDGFDATDDAQLVERNGGKVVLVAGDERNIKITTRADLAMAELLLAEGARGRPGIGYDAHALVEGRPLVLGGVVIPSARGLDGHSDADVVLHAITNALLGAGALGDIGQHFPSSDDRWKDAPSEVFVREAVRMLEQAGLGVAFVDVTVIIQEPPIAPHRDAMRGRIAGLLGIDVSSVSVKATTTDRLGHIGAREGAAAVAIARVEPR